MPPRSLFLALLLACAGLLTTSAASAGLLGKTLTVSYYNNTTLVSTTSAQVTVGNSIELSNWPSAAFPSPQFPKLYVNITDTAITVTNYLEAVTSWRLTSSSTIPIYFVIKDTTDNVPAFSSDPTKTFLSNTITGLTDSDLTVTDNSISLLLDDAILPAKSNGGSFTIQVGFANTTPTPVPTPAPLLLIVFGLFINKAVQKVRRPQLDYNQKPLKEF